MVWKQKKISSEHSITTHYILDTNHTRWHSSELIGLNVRVEANNLGKWPICTSFDKAQPNCTKRAESSDELTSLLLWWADPEYDALQ